MNCYILLFITFVNKIQCFFNIEALASKNLRRLPKDFPEALVVIAAGLPTKSLTVVRGNTTDLRSEDIYAILHILCNNNIQVINLDLKTAESKDGYFRYLKKGLDTSEERSSLILCEPEECEDILYEITINNYIHRSILYIFFWPRGEVSKLFLSGIKEAIRVAVITNPRPSVFRLYYNQATPDKLNHLTLVNWWSGRLYKSPALPPADKVYQDFKGRIFNVPVLHAPPWHFVVYKNDSTVNVTGGRDDKLLSLLSKKLNFKYQYYDPPERSQGSRIAGNGTFKGTLGLIWKRKADFFIGDVTMTWERLQAVEFSFLTLADSGAFLTHAPDKLSETLAIIRPFRWEVWLLVGATLLVTGPALWVVIAAPTLWQRRKRNQLGLLNNCCWFTTSLFLRQSSSKEPSRTHKARLVSIFISLGATYVIGDMYSANLTSLLARPAREQPIGTLQALEEAMRDKGYELVVEGHSSSMAILQNGTGVYGRLARLMRRQRIQRVRSVEVGVRLVLTKRRVVILGGRETLFYDTERFGSHNFHLSEKLYTRYSAVALQIGCPYLESFNNVIMTLFEAGILAKMTTDEYKNLPEHSRRSEPVTESDKKESSDAMENTQTPQAQPESTIGLEPVSLRMLRGAFCLLSIGYFLAAVVLVTEIQVHRKKEKIKTVEPFQTAPTKRKSARVRVKQRFERIFRNIYVYLDKALRHDGREYQA
ncbi:ionotropic receptor 40a [Vanessa cardui]|uniref:ionotropic receptor 40a n=1 Tax=Vanessa cardui TaxID=171605 RepID=UPI001F1464BE|nr:ionotropic receptor 40a [Vanessa cardui]